MDKETSKKPWVSPQIVEINIKMTENAGGINYDIANQAAAATDPWGGGGGGS